MALLICFIDQISCGQLNLKNFCHSINWKISLSCNSKNTNLSFIGPLRKAPVFSEIVTWNDTECVNPNLRDNEFLTSILQQISRPINNSQLRGKGIRDILIRRNGQVKHCCIRRIVPESSAHKSKSKVVLEI
jgi:hypothetical protein